MKNKKAVPFVFITIDTAVDLFLFYSVFCLSLASSLAFSLRISLS